MAGAFFDAVVGQARSAGLLSDEHFTVDSTQLEAWASLKSFPRPDAERQPPPDDPGNPTVDFHGERRSNRTQRSTTDPDAQRFRKGGTDAVLGYLAHALLDNRHGLVVNTCVTAATGTAEWDAVEILLANDHRGTVGRDKNYDVRARAASRRMWRRSDSTARSTDARRVILATRCVPSTRHQVRPRHQAPGMSQAPGTRHEAPVSCSSRRR